MGKPSPKIFSAYSEKVKTFSEYDLDLLKTRFSFPILLIEIKLSDETPAASLMAFQNFLNIPAVQLVKKEGVKKIYKNGKNDVLVMTAHRWLSALP